MAWLGLDIKIHKSISFGLFAVSLASTDAPGRARDVDQSVDQRMTVSEPILGVRRPDNSLRSASKVARLRSKSVALFFTLLRVGNAVTKP